MATASPKWGYTPTSLFPYNPSEEELQKLVHDIQALTKIQPSDDFKETLKRLLILMRKRADAARNAPSIEELRAELQQFQRAIKALHEIFSYKGLSEHLRMEFVSRMMRYDLHSEFDPLYNAHVATDVLLYFCDEVQEGLRNPSKNPHTLTATRDEILRELARALDEAGYKPTATRDGPFQKCVHLFLEAVSCTVNDRKVRVSIPEDSFKLIRMAVKQYPLTPKLGLLEKGKIIPGFAG